MTHPNATIGGLGGGAGLGTLLVWLLNKYADAGLGPEEASAIAGGMAAAVLFIGRKGVRGLVRIFWRGSDRR